MVPKAKALVVLSGGADSTTCLSWAREQFKEVHAITFDYAQRHNLEIDAAKKVGAIIGVDSHEIVTLGPVLKGTSPLTNPDFPVEHYPDVDSLPGGLEKTFVPGRNILFLTLAANRAFVLGVHHLVTGLCQEDFGGYPDCRNEFVIKMEAALSEGLGYELTIHTPLMFKTKAESVLLAVELAKRDEGRVMRALAQSHTCYDGMYPPNPKNHASLLRAKGFEAAGIADPLIVRAKLEGLLPSDYPDSGLVEGTKYNEHTGGPISF